MSEFPYEESYGPAYNYEVGYLEGLREAHRLALIQSQHPSIIVKHLPLAEFLKKRIEQQKECVKEEIPDETLFFDDLQKPVKEEMPDE